MKKIILNTTLIGALVTALVGCGVTEHDSLETENDTTSIGEALKVTETKFLGNSTLEIEWQRTGKVKDGSYTQLEIKNDINTYKIAKTNNGNKIIIDCTSILIESDRTKYICQPDNIDHSYSLYLENDEDNIVQERAGDKTFSLGKIKI